MQIQPDDILELILSRRTVHNYTSEAVPQAVIEKAIVAAVHAPNHKLTWPWRFFLVGPQVRAQLAALQVEAKAKKADTEMTEALKKSLFDNFMQPGALLVLGIAHDDDPDRALENYASLACAVQNMSLYFATEGFGSKWSTGKVTRSDKTYDALGISREAVDLHGWLWVGRAARPTRKPERPPVEQFLKTLP